MAHPCALNRKDGPTSFRVPRFRRCTWAFGRFLLRGCPRYRLCTWVLGEDFFSACPRFRLLVPGSWGNPFGCRTLCFCFIKGAGFIFSASNPTKNHRTRRVVDLALLFCAGVGPFFSHIALLDFRSAGGASEISPVRQHWVRVQKSLERRRCATLPAHAPGHRTHYFSNNFIHFLITARKSFSLDFTSFAPQNIANLRPSA
jgi:hypothetical protein